VINYVLCNAIAMAMSYLPMSHFAIGVLNFLVNLLAGLIS